MATLKNKPLTARDLKIKVQSRGNARSQLEVNGLNLQVDAMNARTRSKALSLVNLYWSSAVVNEYAIDAWLAEHLPRGVSALFLVELIEAAGTKALNAGYSQYNKAGAAAARPTRKKFSAAIVQCMKRSKKKGTSFKAFMSDWEKEAINGMALRADAIAIGSAPQKSKYTVIDENGKGGKGPLGKKSYAGSTLANLYSQAD
jgi:hypothetical protein